MRSSHPGRSVHACPRRTFASLRIPAFRWYWTGRLVSASGTSIVGVAEAWWLADRAGSAGVWLGLYFAAFAVPALAGGAWAGLLADRLSKRRLLVITELSLMVNEAALCALSAGGLLRPWLLVLGACTWSAINTVAAPARDTLAAELVDTNRLPNAVALGDFSVYAASIAGSATAGLVIGAWGLTAGWAASALSTGALLVALLAIGRTVPLPGAPRAPEPRAPRQLRDAAAAVRRDRALGLPIAGASLIAALAMNLGALVPLLVRETHGDARAFALLNTGIAVGSAIGALAAARRRLIAPAAFLAPAGGAGMLDALAAMSPSLIWRLIALSGASALSAVFLAAVKAHLQLAAAEGMRGRIMALYLTAMSGCGLVGGLLSGWLADRWTARSVLLAGGLAAAVVAFALTAAAGKWQRKETR